MRVGKTPIGQRRLGLLLMATVACMTLAAPLRAAETAAEAASATAGQTAEAPLPADAVFTTEELRTLLAPIALYPDALLAQLLPATAYPVDIVMAARWLDKNETAVKKGDFSGADAQGWDPAVKALMRFPDIIERLNTDLDATSDLGDAFVNQPDDVAAVIQDLRREAQKAGSLKSSPQQTVTVQQQAGSSNATTDYVVIEPADPGVIYVPTYDPATVYYEDTTNVGSGLIGFGVGVAVGAAIDNAWDWGRGYVYPPRWPGYPGYRPGVGGGINNGNINIGNDINIGAGNTRPWRPDAGKYHPGQGSKPGLANRPGAGGVNRAAGVGGRPDGIANARPGGGDLGSAKAVAGNRASAAKGGARSDGIKNSGAAKGAVSNKAAGAKGAAASKGSGGAKKAAAAKAGNKSAGKAASRPANARPAPQRPANTAFSGASLGGASGAMANRGAVSRQSVARPGGGRPQMSRGGGGGGRAQMPRGGGGGGRGGRR
ncbi:Protein of unknown function [Kaistia soli DSM 19436]|uniref:DUF3300 domain-containing protein n=1 Tax=Kaistia soli DSM 19436 TaxID=1122133 RepID=A0A1M4VB23_9HYPH|nr:DUF3300 domain-containing protein [Kaistia soli]SHE66205.1 Protein of unknown function [Kaistia soli DSM 19436]